MSFEIPTLFSKTTQTKAYRARIFSPLSEKKPGEHTQKVINLCNQGIGASLYLMICPYLELYMYLVSKNSAEHNAMRAKSFEGKLSAMIHTLGHASLGLNSMSDKGRSFSQLPPAQKEAIKEVCIALGVVSSLIIGMVLCPPIYLVLDLITQIGGYLGLATTGLALIGIPIALSMDDDKKKSPGLFNKSNKVDVDVDQLGRAASNFIEEGANLFENFTGEVSQSFSF